MTAVPASEARKPLSGPSLPLELRLALRDLRGGLAGFSIFLICIALGTGAIGTINSLSEAIQNAIARDGKVLLGGDAEATLVHRKATPEEKAYLNEAGEVSEVATLRAMARKADGSAQALVDLKAVDGAYPLYGQLALGPGQTFASVISRQGVAVDRSILDQLQIGIGDNIAIGLATFPVAAVIEHEPDRLAAGPALGARIIMPIAELDKTGLIQPGSLVRWNYRVKLRPGLTAAAFKKKLAEKFPEAGFLVRDSSDPSPGVKDMLERMTEFLTLTGITAMLVGGIGVANAVSGFIERRRMTIATFKSLGASQRIVFRVFFTEIALLALFGIAIGFIITGMAPLASAGLLHKVMPIGIAAAPQPYALALAGLFGLLATLPFVLWPLGRAQQVRPAELFRDKGGETAGLPPWTYRIGSIAAAGALALAAIGFSHEHRIAAFTCGALLGIFVLFWLAGSGIRIGAALIKRPNRPGIALAVANIAGPSSLARTIALSLGSGLTLLTAVSLVDASLTDELKSRLPDRAPDYFFIGVPKQDLGAFQGLLSEKVPGSEVSAAPMLRGRIVSLKGVPVEEIKAPSSAGWVLNGDRGITYSEDLPAGSKLTEGHWWEPGYEGEPLVSFEADIAKALNLKIGDAVTVNVIGKNITAKIANLRKVKWGTIGINFVMIFSPNALRKAPFTYLATLSHPEGKNSNPGAEAAALRAVATAYPTVSAISVKEALDAISGVFEKIMTAVTIAGSLTVVMGSLVVAGALITAQRRRIYEAVVLRTLGASKRRILAAHLWEYLGLALCLSVIACGLGLAAAYAVVAYIMNLSFTVSLNALLQPSIIETIFVVVLGAAGTLRVLSAKPAHYLRSE